MTNTEQVIEAIKTPVRYSHSGAIYDAQGRVLIQLSESFYRRFRNEGRSVIGEHIALCINDHARLISELERVKGEKEKLKQIVAEQECDIDRLQKAVQMHIIVRAALKDESEAAKLFTILESSNALLSRKVADAEEIIDLLRDDLRARACRLARVYRVKYPAQGALEAVSVDETQLPLSLVSDPEERMRRLAARIDEKGEVK